jgi:hypothetical protein
LAVTAAGCLDKKTVRRPPRHHRLAQGIQSAGLQAPGHLGDPFVPVGIELHPPLLHHHAEKIPVGVKGDSTQI